ncbi:MAG: hypothetical protein LBK42_13385 [Propionibacteriaceae bacterium]|jgi:hypothetical protein|nr:hypothetical protein [Propionibacteriaceae bacterium]
MSSSNGGSPGDLIIADAEFLYAEQAAIAYRQRLREAAQRLADILVWVLERAIRQSATTPGLESAVARLHVIAAGLDGVVPAGRAAGFIARVDQLDDFVY